MLAWTYRFHLNMAVRFPTLSWIQAAPWLHHSSFRFAVDACVWYTQLRKWKGAHNHQCSLTPLGFQPVPLGGRNDCDSISPAVVQTGQTTGGTDTQQDSPSRHGSAGKGHCLLLSISPVSPLLLVHGSGQPVTACQHFLDEGIPRAWADRCPNPGLLCTGCMSHHRGRCSMCGGGTTVPSSYAVALQHFRWWLPPAK